MLKKAATIRDVARACGRSHMTVSNVLNNRGTVSAATRADVLEAVRRLNFRPSAIARRMNRVPMDTIGFVLPHAFQAPTAHPYYSLMLDGVMDAAVVRRMDVIAYTGSLWTTTGDGLGRYNDGRSDGLLVVTPAVDSVLVPALLEAQVPFVSVSDYYSEPEVSCVYIDDVSSEANLVDYLLDMGHERIAMMCGDEIAICVAPRREGYRLALQRRGIAIDESLILYGGFELSTIRPRVEYIASLPRSKRPTAICATNDQIALVMLTELARVGLRVPEDISVVGFDDVRGAEAAGLTTMGQPIREIGVRAVEILTGLISGEITEPQKERYRTELVRRNSVRAIVKGE